MKQEDIIAFDTAAAEMPQESVVSKYPNTWWAFRPDEKTTPAKAFYNKYGEHPKRALVHPDKTEHIVTFVTWAEKENVELDESVTVPRSVVWLR